MAVSWALTGDPRSRKAAASGSRRRSRSRRPVYATACIMSDVIASRLAGFGTTIFTEISALAERTGAINLGQGFPDEDGPAEVLEAAAAAMRAGHNQYAPLAGVPALRDAVVAHQERVYGLTVEDVQVTFGATEATAAAML